MLYTRGLPEMNDVFWHTHWEGAVQQSTYPSKDFSGNPETASQPNVANYKEEWWGPEDKTPRSIRYTASFKAAKAGKYLVLAAASAAITTRSASTASRSSSRPRSKASIPNRPRSISAPAKPSTVVADYLPGFVGNRFGLGIVNEADMISEDAKKFASAADVVVVSVGFNPSTESEGLDRTFTLPWGQDALIEAVAAANPHTIVTLTGGGGMDTRRWLDKVPALLHTWYPGQEGGTAVAAGSLRQARSRRQAARQLRSQLGRQSIVQVTTTRFPAPTPRCTSSKPTASPGRLHHPAREVRRQADGRLSLLDHHRQASALSVRIRPELHDVQLLQSGSARNAPLRAPRSQSAST